MSRPAKNFTNMWQPAPTRCSVGTEPTTVDRLLTSGDVADLLAVTPRWVEEHVRLGHIPHVRLGRFVRFRRQAVLDAKAQEPSRLELGWNW